MCFKLLPFNCKGLFNLSLSLLETTQKVNKFIKTYGININDILTVFTIRLFFFRFHIVK